MNRLDGVRNAKPEKRYKNFITTTADRGEVWVLTSESGYATWDENGVVHLIVYPTFEAANQFCENDAPESIEIHSFLTRCEQNRGDDTFRFMVYPNGVNAYIVDVEKMICDLKSELELIE